MGSNLAICGLLEGNSGGSVEVLVWKRRKGRPIKIFLEPSHFALPRSEVKEDKFLLPNEKKHRNTNFFPVINLVAVQLLTCVWLFATPWLPCPSLSPGVCSSSCPLSWWCHRTISSSVAPFSFCPQFSPALGSFPMSQLFASWPKYWSFTSASVQSFQWIFRVDILRTDWFDLLGVLKVS